MIQRRKRRVPGLNTTATADISFMLLIFFLVTSSMDTDKGLPLQLPPPQDEHVEQELLVKDRNVLEISLDDADQLFCNGEPIVQEALSERVAEFVANAKNDLSLPEKSRREVHLLGLTEVSDRHVLALQVSRHSSYDAYFQMRNKIAMAYIQLRDELAKNRFGHGLRQCDAEQQAALAMVYPQRISETVTGEEGGEP